MHHLRGLIINADDFGHFQAVSQGILECIDAGTVTATGIMPCGPAFEATAPALVARVAAGQADAGVHLTLTYGHPLSPALRNLYPEGFPGKGRLVRDLVMRRLTVRAVREEWTLQVTRCLDAGLAPCFLNGHEHVHLLPPLWPLALGLARRYALPYVRRPGAGPGKARVLRWMHAACRLRALGHRRAPGGRPSPPMFGGECSGHMTLATLERALAQLARAPAGSVAEYMCHPGRDNPAEMADPRLRMFHDWEGERAVLCDPALPSLLARQGVRLVRFRDL